MKKNKEDDLIIIGMKMNKDDLTIVEMKMNEDKHLLEITTDDETVHYFPDYAFEFLLDIMQKCRDTSDLMKYADLLNKHMMTEYEEDC